MWNIKSEYNSEWLAKRLSDMLNNVKWKQEKQHDYGHLSVTNKKWVLYFGHKMAPKQP